MPELPEVETVCRTLAPWLVGRTLYRVDLKWPKLLRETRKEALSRLIGCRIRGLRRRGKMIFIDFESGKTLLFHLKMTGQLFLASKAEPRDRHLRLILTFDNPDLELRFRDPRKFGYLMVFPTAEETKLPFLNRLGPEPESLSRRRFLSLFSRHKGKIKPLLLRQDFIAGIGNIYADEILHEAGIHPERAVNSLTDEELGRLYNAMKRVLARAIRHRGTSVRDYRDGLGERGSFQNQLKVYGRQGEKCRRCQATVERKKVSGRSAFFCPGCQA